MGEQVGNVAILRATPEEDRIKKYIVQGVENLTSIMKEITQNTLEGRLDYYLWCEFKSELISLYFYSAKSKIASVEARLPEESRKEKRFSILYDLDYYMLNPDKLSLEDAITYAQKLREFFDEVGLFDVESVVKKQ